MLVRDIRTNDFASLVLGVAAAGSLLAAWAGPGPRATCIIATALVFVGLRIVWQDLADFTIPDAATLALGLIGLTVRIGEGARLAEPAIATLGFALLDTVICGGVLLAIREAYFRSRGHDGIGLGDVKLGAAGGLLLGTVGLSWAILGASLAGLAFVGAVRIWPSVSRPKPATGRIAFGAVLIPALWAAWLIGQLLSDAPGQF